jgi:uncharacterized protein with HEPN domain
MAERLRQDAVISELEFIGEAVKQLSTATKERRPEIPWKQIAGMRDRLTHDYFGVDFALVWRAVERDLPALKAAVMVLLLRQHCSRAARPTRKRSFLTRPGSLHYPPHVAAQRVVARARLGDDPGLDCGRRPSEPRYVGVRPPVYAGARPAGGKMRGAGGRCLARPRPFLVRSAHQITG